MYTRLCPIVLKNFILSDLQEAQIEGASISSELQEGADPNNYDDDNWETFSEKSFSTVSKF